MANKEDGNSNRQNQIKSKLLPHIQNAYALENQLVETLERHRDEAKDFPDIQAKIAEHFEVTKIHRDRVKARLEAYGEKPSADKDAASSMMGNMAGAVAAFGPEGIARIARDEYVSEHLEIAAYTLLMTTAMAFNDMETMRVAEQNLRDEVEMQSWLLQHMPDACLRALEQEGVEVSQQAWQAAMRPNPAAGSEHAYGGAVYSASGGGITAR